MTQPPPDGGPPGGGTLVLFPRAEYLDGTLSADEVARLDRATDEYARADPQGLQRSLAKMSGFQPLEFYEGMASMADQVVLYLLPTYRAGADVPFLKFKDIVEAVQGTCLTSWAQRRVARSILDAIR